MVNGIFIDAVNLEVKEVKIKGELNDYYKLLYCNCIAAPSYDYEHDIIVDDEGLLKNHSIFFEIDGAEYAGSGFIVGVNPNTGYWKSHSLNFEEIKNKITFHTYIKFNGQIMKIQIG